MPDRGKPKVFLVGGFETGSGKPEVSFGKELKQTKEFKSVKEAEEFAIKKAKELGVKKFLKDLPSGTTEVDVEKRIREEKKKMKKKKKRTSDLGLNIGLELPDLRF